MPVPATNATLTALNQTANRLATTNTPAQRLAGVVANAQAMMATNPVNANRPATNAQGAGRGRSQPARNPTNAPRTNTIQWRNQNEFDLSTPFIPESWRRVMDEGPPQFLFDEKILKVSPFARNGLPVLARARTAAIRLMGKSTSPYFM